MSLYLSVVQLYASEVISLGLLVLEDSISMQSVPWYVYRHSNATITNNLSQLLLKSLVGTYVYRYSNAAITNNSQQNIMVNIKKLGRIKLDVSAKISLMAEI